MKHATIRLMIVVLGFMIISVGTRFAWADRQVLLAFDESGYLVKRVISVPNRRLLQESPTTDLEPGLALGTQIELTKFQLQSGEAALIWQDETGRVIQTDSISDPRIAHAPAHVFGQTASLMVEREGAWIATAPDKAQHLTLLLAAHSVLSLGFEQWELPLYESLR